MKKALWIIVIVLLSGVAVWQICEVRKRKAGIEQIVRVGEDAGKSATVVAEEENKEEITAASIVPADCSFFSSNLLLKDQFVKVRDSEAMKRLLSLPIVQVQLLQLRSLPQFQQAKDLLETSPPARDAIEVAKDAISNEVFVCGDASWVKVLDSFVAWTNDVRICNFKAGMREGIRGAQGSPGVEDAGDVASGAIGQSGAFDTVETVKSLLKYRDGLFTPGMLIGLKLSGSEEKLRHILESITARINESLALPATVNQVEINGNRYYTMAITRDAVPEGTFEKIRGKLESAGCTQQEASEFIDWAKSIKVVVTAGYCKPYFIVSIGSDNAFLERLGRAASLDGSPVFAPVNRFKGRRVASIGYASWQMAVAGRFDPGQFREMARALIDALPEEKSPEGFSESLDEKLEKFSRDIEATMPVPSEIVSVSILNRGVESFTFTKSPQPGVDYSRPLTILEHAGGSPILAAACGSSGCAGEYETLRKWALSSYGLVQTYLAPELGEEKRDRYERLRSVAIPFLRVVDEATRQHLIPAVDAGQSLVVVDTGMRISKLWKDRVLESPLPFLMPAYAIELKDAAQFKAAIKAYAAASEELVNSAARLKQVAPGDEEAEFSVPAPEVTPLEEGKVFLYTPSKWLDAEIQPNLAVKDDLAVFSLSPGQTEAMCRKEEMPENEVVAMDLPSGCVFRFRSEPLIGCVREWVNYRFRERSPDEATEGEGAAAVTAILKQTVEELLNAIGTFKGITSRTYMDGDYVVTHSWAEFRDE